MFESLCAKQCLWFLFSCVCDPGVNAPSTRQATPGAQLGARWPFNPNPWQIQTNPFQTTWPFTNPNPYVSNINVNPFPNPFTQNTNPLFPNTNPYTPNTSTNPFAPRPNTNTNPFTLNTNTNPLIPNTNTNVNNPSFPFPNNNNNNNPFTTVCPQVDCSSLNCQYGITQLIEWVNDMPGFIPFTSIHMLHEKVVATCDFHLFLFCSSNNCRTCRCSLSRCQVRTARDKSETEILVGNWMTSQARWWDLFGLRV